MNSKEQEFEWHKLKELWMGFSRTKEIRELKKKISRFEKGSVKTGLAALKRNWKQFKGMAGQFEKDAVNNDLTKIKYHLKNFFPEKQ